MEWLLKQADNKDDIFELILEALIKKFGPSKEKQIMTTFNPFLQLGNVAIVKIDGESWYGQAYKKYPKDNYKVKIWSRSENPIFPLDDLEDE